MRDMPDPKAAFLGPQSENEDILERMILEVLRDHIYWRKNFHPTDSPLIQQEDKYKNEFLSTVNTMKQELFYVLGELKKGVPFFSPRYLAHINSDLLLPAIIGYFGAMLYNQNNVVAESSPITIIKELEYIKSLCEMVGYPRMDYQKLIDNPANSSWGHLSSGGTSANLEPMWVTRNAKSYPLSIKLYCLINEAYKFLNDIDITLTNGIRKKMSEINAFELLSLNPQRMLNFRHEIKKVFEKENKDFQKFEEELPTVQKLGLVEFYKHCVNKNLNFNLPVIVVPCTRHYCWPKIADILGLGRNEKNLIEIPVTNSFKIDLSKLKSTLEGLAKNKVPILSMTIISGTTEEGALDSLDKVIEIRQELEQDGFSFWIHSDAAYGGYFASMLNGSNEKAKKHKEKFPSIEALKEIDSIAIDPHKLGYIPYPSGAVIYRDSRVREHITYEAPYLSDKEDVTKAFLGKWTLEGSRPGAAAISCYLSQHTYPLNIDGYGKMLSHCINATQSLNKAFATINSEPKKNYGFQIINLYEPELNIICYIVTSPDFIKDPNTLNELTKLIFEKFTVTGEFHSSHYDFIVSKTDYPYKKYKEQIISFLKKCKIDYELNSETFSLFVLRSVLMNPLSSQESAIFENFAESLCKAAYEVLPTIQLEKIKEKYKNRSANRRMNLLIIEDSQDESDSLKFSLELEQNIGNGLDIRSVKSKTETNELLKSFKPDATIIDLDLGSGVNEGLNIIEEFQRDGSNNIIVHSRHLSTPVVEKTLEKDLKIPKYCQVLKPKNEGTDEEILKRKKEISRQILNILLSFL